MVCSSTRRTIYDARALFHAVYDSIHSDFSRGTYVWKELLSKGHVYRIHKSCTYDGVDETQERLSSTHTSYKHDRETCCDLLTQNLSKISSKASMVAFFTFDEIFDKF